MAEDQIGQVMDELLVKVKSAPEAEQVAMKALIDQMHQIAEQMKQTREIDHFQDLQQKMVAQWVKLKQMCEGNPELMEQINIWKKQFISNKKVMMEMITAFKGKITDKTQELQQIWNNMYSDISIMRGICGRFYVGYSAFSKFSVFVELEETVSKEEQQYLKYDTLKGFINACNSVTTGHNLIDAGLPEFEINNFLAKMNEARGDMMAWAWKKQELLQEEKENIRQVVPVEEYPELKEKLEGLETKLNNLSQVAKDIIKLFSMIKIIRDAKMLEAY